MIQSSYLFDDAEIDELQRIIEKKMPETTMDTGMIDGLMTAHLLFHKHPRLSHIIPTIIAREEGSYNVRPDTLDRFTTLLNSRFQCLQAALQAGNGLEPIILPVVDDQDNVITTGRDFDEALFPWATGFIYGVMLVAQEDGLEYTDNTLRLLRHITTYVPENSFRFDDNEEPISNLIIDLMKNPAPKADNLEDALINIVKTVYQIKDEIRPNEPIRVRKRVGRNDPCPCGSGKKYKQCCGKRS